ncbi:MAG: hypothetical protein LBU39_05435 [Desulfobulbaceae bacterium]|jgi:addiction module RelB/DinJ family antitoxin|nr:hypothetical protein [Desulfobulbaceae bacterium]
MKIEADVDEKIVQEAERILNDVGLDISMAINILLRRTVNEKSFPLQMVGGSKRESGAEQHQSQGNRTNIGISQDMVEDVWRTFLVSYRESGEIAGGELNRLSEEIHRRSGMSRGSAFIYLVILNNLVHGKANTRNMKMMDLEYYMERIRQELGEKLSDNALDSLRQSISYWRQKIPGKFSADVEELLGKELSNSKLKGKVNEIRETT